MLSTAFRRVNFKPKHLLTCKIDREQKTTQSTSNMGIKFKKPTNGENLEKIKINHIRKGEIEIGIGTCC
jgi:outer membrane phospholipase A